MAVFLESEVQLQGRLKGNAASLVKMMHRRLGPASVLDAIGIRAVVARTRDCYRLVRYVHAGFPFLASEYDDYFAVPQLNGYRALHTTVLSEWGLPVEIQIRSKAMHHHAKRGAASHALYKMEQAAGAGRG